MRQRRSSWDIPTKTPQCWIPDDRATACFRCGTPFSLFVRKHHCRMCSRIHCYQCSAFQSTVPSFMHHLCNLKPHEDKHQALRLCHACFTHVQHATTQRQLIYILVGLPLLLPHKILLRSLNTTWRTALDTVLGIYKGMFYMFNERPYTRLEILLLRTHCRELLHHRAWHVHLINAQVHTCGQRPIHSSCIHMLCRPTCQPHLTCGDVLRLFPSRHRRTVAQLICHTWRTHIPIACHERMVLYWIPFAKDNPLIFQHGFLPLCHQSKTFATIAYTTTRSPRILKHVPAHWHHGMRNALRFTSLASTLAHDPRHAKTHIQAFQQHPCHFYLPWNPHVTCLNIDSSSAHVLSSSSKPLRLVLDVQDKAQQREHRITILIKQDNVLRDYVAMTVAFWMNRLCHTNIVTYDVFPLGTHAGIIQLVPHTTTLYDLHHTHHVTMLNYILSHNPSRTVADVRASFVQSCVGACMFAYCVGVGDRHLQNILLTPHGHLLHIDFGYMFGTDPKASHAHIRITQGTIDALGGLHSSTYATFVAQCQDLYTRMRQHVLLWHALCVRLLPATQHATILHHILERFVPGELDNLAHGHIATVVDSASTPSLDNAWTDLTRHVSHTLHTFFRMDM